jgi:hypothetical protein
MAINEAGPSLLDECARARATVGIPPLARAVLEWHCTYIPGEDAEAFAAVRGRPWPAARARPDDARARLLSADDDALRADAADAQRLLIEERSRPGRAALATVGSCLLQALDEPRRAADLALVAVQADPRSVTTPHCSAWEQAAPLSKSTPSAAGVTRAYAAWVPWSSYPWWPRRGE